MINPKSFEKYSITELQVIIAAITHEFYEFECMTDSSYDILAYEVKDTLTEKLPGYVPYSGMWVQDIINDEWRELAEACMEKIATVNHDFFIHHTYLWDILGRDD